MKKANLTWEIIDKVRYLTQKGYLDTFGASDAELFERQMRDRIHAIMLDSPEDLKQIAEKERQVKFLVACRKTIDEQKIGFWFRCSFNFINQQD